MALRVGFVSCCCALIVRAGRIRDDPSPGSTARAGSLPRKMPELGRTRHAALFRERRQQQANALDSVLRNAAFGHHRQSIAVVIILGDLGLNLAPVLASARVLGVAIGFGAQNLVKDFPGRDIHAARGSCSVGDVIGIGDMHGNGRGVSLQVPPACGT